MGKAKWGVIVAVVVAIAVVVLARHDMFTNGDRDQSTDTDATAGGAGAGSEAPAATQSTGERGDDEVAASASGTGESDAADTAAKDTADTASDGRSDAGAADRATDDGTGGLSGQEPVGELQREAEKFVRELAESSDEPVPVQDAQGFVSGDRPLATAGGEVEAKDATRAAMPEAGNETDAGVVESDEQVAAAAPGAGAGRDADGPEAGVAEVAAAPEAGDAEPGTEEPGVAGDEAPEDADAAAPDIGRTPEADSADASTAGADVAAAEGETAADAGGDVAIAAGSDGTDAGEAEVEGTVAATVDLPLTDEAPVTIAELLGAEEAVAKDAVFYVHTVKPDDDEGIWGIVHEGITRNFAQGVAVHRGGETETYRVDIPGDADQIEPDDSSSFLGKLIHEKSRETYVYNFRTDRLGRNPHLIMPGQEIVIVSFTPEELIAIYKHFATQGGDS